MPDQLALVVLKLSDSFASLWDDVADELEIEVRGQSPDRAVDEDAVAVVISAGGEEARGLDLLSSLDRPPAVPAYLVGTNTSHRFGIEAVRRGASDYFGLPADLDLLRRTLTARAEEVAARRAAERSGSRGGFASVVGESAALRATLDRAQRILPHGDVTVLITGETGTGKEVLAKAIHDGGPRAGKPFVAVNCAAIPATLLESELFGHERGAFTDAREAKSGLFEEADGGTLFLDEIGHLPVPLQGKILRALEEKRIRRVGGTQSRDVDVRVIAATHVNLTQATARGEFREDLYYRLNVVSLRLPALRERGGDLEILTRRFADSLAERYGLPRPEVTPELLAALRAHQWPGNVRELRHAIERAMLLSPPGTVDPGELALADTAPGGVTGVLPFPATLREISNAAVAEALRVNDGNKSAAARQLGISRARLQRLLDHPEANPDAD